APGRAPSRAPGRAPSPTPAPTAPIRSAPAAPIPSAPTPRSPPASSRRRPLALPHGFSQPWRAPPPCSKLAADYTEPPAPAASRAVQRRPCTRFKDLIVRRKGDAKVRQLPRCHPGRGFDAAHLALLLLAGLVDLQEINSNKNYPRMPTTTGSDEHDRPLQTTSSGLAFRQRRK
uniref:Uncharacterized protein n=1 Tax=Aegilops tauschii subsp. strangulata TaxID=200361 RepID=A0A453K7T2_AEGTS